MIWLEKDMDKKMEADVVKRTVCVVETKHQIAGIQKSKKEGDKI